MRPPARSAAFVFAIALGGNLAAQEPVLRLETELRSFTERLSGGRTDWRNTQIDLQARNSDRQSYYGSLRESERFDRSDSEVTLGTYQPLGGSWAAQLEAAASPTHNVLAKNSLLAQLERRFEGGWGVQAGYRRSTFERNDTDLVIATVDRYFSKFRGAYSLYLGRPDRAGFGSSHRLQWGYYYSDRSFVGLSASSGKEAENIFPGGVLTTRVSSLSIAGRHEFAPGWAASYEWLAHRQGDLYTRRGFGLGIRHFF